MCNWGYVDSGACMSGADASNVCNLWALDVGGALPTAESLYSGTTNQCWAEWGTPDVFDVTGNLRELTVSSSTGFYTVAGGSFTTEFEEGAACGFDFLDITGEQRLFDAGFRCCFLDDPTDGL